MNFVCIVFKLGDKMLTLSSMENHIVLCNLKVFNIYMGMVAILVLCPGPFI